MVLLAVVVMLVQIPAVQTFIGKCAVRSLLKKSADAEISFSQIKIKPFNTLIVKDLTIVDKIPYTVDTASLDPERQRIFREMNYCPVDTLFSAENLTATFTLNGLMGKGMRLNSAYLRNARLNLTIEEENGHSINITRMFRIPEKQHRDVEDKDIFIIKKVDVEGMRLTMKNYRVTKCHDIDTAGINWNDLDIGDLTVHGRNLKLRGKVMSGVADYVSFREKSGYILDNLSASAIVGRSVALIKDIRLHDPWSDLDVPHFSMHYDYAWDLAQFLRKVRIVAEMNKTMLNFRTLSYFAPKIRREDFILDIRKGSVNGPVDSLSVTGLDFSTSDGLIRGVVDAKMRGLPNLNSLSASVNLKNLHFSSEGAQNLLAALGKTGDGLDVRRFAPGIEFTLDGGMRGKPNDMKFNGFIRSSSSGSLVADLRVRDLLNRGRNIDVDGVVRTSSLNLHSMWETIPAEECTMDAFFSADLAGKGTASTLKIDSLKVSGLKYNGYNYTKINAAGTITENQFDGKIVCNDPNINFIIQGLLAFSLKTKNSLYRFYANVGHADLFALNLDRRGRSEVDVQISANFTKTAGKVWLGEIDLADLHLLNSAGKHDIGNVKIESYAGKNKYQMRFSSKFAEGTFSGSASIIKFFSDAQNVTARRELPALFKDASYDWSGEHYDLSFKTGNTSDVLSFVAPGVYIAEGTSVKVKLDKKGIFSGKVVSQRIAYKERYIKDFTLNLDNSGDILTGVVTGGSIDLSPLMIRDNRFEISARNNRVSINYKYDNSSEVEDDSKTTFTASDDKGEMIVLASVSRDRDGRPSVDVRPQQSTFRIASRDWKVHKSSITLEGTTLSVNNFRISSGEQSISAYGKMSDSRADTLQLAIGRLDLSMFNALLGNGYDITGTLSGKALITSPKDARRLLLDFQCDSAGMGGESMGHIAFATKWDDTFSKFHILAANDIDGVTTFALNGYYTPSIKAIDMMAKLDDLSLGYTRPFLRSVFSEVTGYISGDLIISGTMDDLSIHSRNPVLENTRLRVAYTNVAYTADGPFHIDDFGVYFDDVNLTDDYGHKGKLGGKIGYDHLRNMYFDMAIDLRGMQAIDLNEKDNENFYGRLFASGKLNITGTMNSVTLAADVTTTGAGELHVPLSTTQNAGLTDMLKFKEPVVEVEVDPYEEYLSMLREEKEMSGELEVRLNVATDPEVEVWVEVDKASGNVMRGRGSGNLEINVKPKTNVFKINGDYTLNDGNYHFVALGLAARDFNINDGSSIRFNGDIMSSTLDIDASYKTKVSLSTLIADTTSTNSRRTVECGIKVTEKLSNPRLAFSINIPDLDPTVKAQVESALSTEDKIQKQFLALLVSNSFIPDEQSSIVNNSTILFSNVSEIMSNQLNTILQKLNIPVDLGVNYQQNDSGNDVFDVAVSTQLFNNRVTVNGSIGNRQYQSSNSGSEVAGDLDIEIKLDRAGSFKLSLFSHSADSYTNYLDDTQRNGIGVAYQQEFNKFGQWVRRVFTRRKKRREQDEERARAQQTEDLVSIKIGSAK